MIALGLTTALFAYLAGSVQTDIKSALSFASLTQVGIIVAEIGFAGVAGWIAGHSSAGFEAGAATGLVLVPLRRPGPPPGPRLPADAPVSAGADAAARLSSARKRHRRASRSVCRRRCAAARRAAESQARLYRFALERGYLDAALSASSSSRRLCGRFAGAMRLERRWTDWLSGGASRESDQVKPQFGTIRRVLMNPLQLPWLELAIGVALFGSALISRLRQPVRAYRWGVAFTGTCVRLLAPGVAVVLPGRLRRPRR